MTNYIFPSLRTVFNRSGQTFTIGQSVQFKGTDEIGVIKEFGINTTVSPNITWVSFTNPDFGQHNIDWEDLIPLNF